MSADRPTHIRLAFTGEGAGAGAELLWQDAPQTCLAVCRLLPFRGTAHHGIYSGSECVLVLDEALRLNPENARSRVTKGEVAFTWMAAGSSYGVDRDFAEVCWFYDIDAEPRMWEGPVKVNVFARIVEPAEAFYAVSRRMRREGVKPVMISTADAMLGPAAEPA